MSDFLETLFNFEKNSSAKLANKIEREKKVDKYLRAMRNYGIYPTLVLMEIYEKENDFLECSIILEAVNRQYEEVKKVAPGLKDKPHPTHISQFTNSMYRKMFDVFGLTGETAKKNTDYYVEKIKKML